jgi:3-oxoacyl-[acyl-carrier-protein] synthase II
MSNREVVITGMGLVSPLGKNVDENWSNVKSAKTGIIRAADSDRPEPLQYMGKVDEYDVPDDIPPKQIGQMKFLNRGATLGFSATHEAIAGHLDIISETDPGRRSLYVASGDFTSAGFDFMYPAIKDASNDTWSEIDSEKLNKSALNKVNPFFLLESLHNNLFSFLSAYVEFMGPNTSLASLSPCGGNALELAYRSIRQNNADIALAVGYGNWITEIPMYELEGLGILSACKSGIHSFKPFDKNRDGFIPGEGGAAIFLESYENAKKRGAKILGKVNGMANMLEFSSSNSISVPDIVTKHCIMSVLKDAGCTVDNLAFLIPHGSGTKKGDRSELNSIKDVLNARKDLPLCGLKPYTGHMGAASDLAEIIVGIKAVRDNTVPATLNFNSAEKAFSELSISNSAQACSKNNFLSVSYGVGGQSSSVIIDAG